MRSITNPVSHSKPKTFCDGEARTIRGRLVSGNADLRSREDGSAMLVVYLPGFKPGQRVSFEIEELV